MTSRPKPPAWIPQEMRAKSDRDTPKPIILLLSAILVALVALIVVLVVYASGQKKASQPPPAASETTMETATTSPTVTQGRSTQPNYTPLNTLSWSAVVQSPPQGFREAIEAHKSSTGIDWAQVEAMADLRSKDVDRPIPDARIVVVIDDNQLANDHDRARLEVGLQGTPVPVIGASQLVTIEGRQLSGVRVILAPIEKADSEVGVAFQKFRFGAVFLNRELVPAGMSGVTF